MLCGRVFQQTVGIHIGTSCAPHFADLLHVPLYFHAVASQETRKETSLVLKFHISLYI